MGCGETSCEDGRQQTRKRLKKRKKNLRNTHETKTCEKNLFGDVGQKPNLLTLQLYHYNDDEWRPDKCQY